MLLEWIYCLWNNHFAATLLEIQGMGVSLRTKTEYGQGLALEHVEIGILIRIYFCWHYLDALDVLFLLIKKGPGQARGSATVPVRVRAWIPYGSIRPMNLVILPSDPVISMVTDSG